MNSMRYLIFSLIFVQSMGHLSVKAETRTDQPKVDQSLVFGSRHGQIVVEGECFFRQTQTQKRAWHLTSETERPDVGRDIDLPHLEGAALGAYIEVLPDTGNDPVGPKSGESISDRPGEMAVVEYSVYVQEPGRYYIWARACGTDGDDNTLHFGIDGTWPETCARMHSFGGQKWTWACRHRQHKGKIFVDIEKPGVHILSVSMREDGCELDRFLLTREEGDIVIEIAELPAVLHAGEMPVFSSTLPVQKPDKFWSWTEAESVVAKEGWEVRQDVEGYSGSGYLEWTKPGQGRKPGDGVMTYAVHVDVAGNYEFLWRSQMPEPANRPETLDPDGNDTWLRFRDGSDVEGQAPLGMEWCKIAILGHPSGWSWNTQWDTGPPHPMTPVTRYFTAGLHELELCGRSSGHRIDGFLLRRFEKIPGDLGVGPVATTDPGALQGAISGN